MDVSECAVTGERGGQVIDDLIEAVAEDLGHGVSVALGFECPLFVPVPEDPLRLGRARVGDGNRAWSAGAGTGAMATGLVQAAWGLRRLRERAPAEHAFVDWVASAAKCDRSSMPIQFPEAVLAQTTGPRVVASILPTRGAQSPPSA
jgi:hypothetical protein